MNWKSLVIFSGMLFFASYFSAEVYQHAGNFLAEGIFSEEGKFSELYFLHLSNQFSRNIFFWIFCSFNLLVSLGESKNRSLMLWQKISLISFAILLIYPDKTQFFIAAFLPVFSIWLGLGWGLLRQTKRWFAYSLSFGFVIAMFIGAHYWAYLNVEKNYNFTQELLMKELDSFVRKYQLNVVYDVIGLMPANNQIRQFLGPNQNTDNDLVGAKLIDDPPDLIVKVGKLPHINKSLGKLLPFKYYSPHPDLFILNTYRGPKCSEPLSIANLTLLPKLEQNAQLQGAVWGGDHNQAFTNIFQHDVEY